VILDDPIGTDRIGFFHSLQLCLLKVHEGKCPYQSKYEFEVVCSTKTELNHSLNRRKLML
jgi:hypothetical protein